MKIKITGDCYAVGDIHGEVTKFVQKLSHYGIKDCTLILLGDIGIWRYRDYHRYIPLDNYCRENNVITYCFRGNHDNPAFFASDNCYRSPLVERFWNKFTNFKVISDLSLVDINGAIGIVIGGGLSIDRCLRRSYLSPYRNNGSLYKNNDWWADENIPDTSGVTDKVEFILSHVGPRPVSAAPLASNCSFFAMDPELKDAINAENKHLEEIHAQFRPKKWWFGHFHLNDVFNFDETCCNAVDIMSFAPIQV